MTILVVVLVTIWTYSRSIVMDSEFSFNHSPCKTWWINESFGLIGYSLILVYWYGDIVVDSKV